MDDDDNLVDSVTSGAREDAQKGKENLASGKSDTTKGSNLVKDKVQQKVKDKVVKKGTQKLAQKAATKAVANSLLAGTLSGALVYVGIALLIIIVIILIIIIVIGIIGFFTTMPGLMKDKLHQIGKEIGTEIKSLYSTEANASITDDEIIDLASYINEMGYDLMGFGFVKPNVYDQVITGEYLEEQRI